MKKQKSDPAIKQEVVSTETTSEETANASTEATKKIKTLEDHQREFDRLSDLFHRKNRFEKALTDLSNFVGKLGNENDLEIESDNFKLVLTSGYSREEIKIGNREVISEAVNYLKARISATIESIENQILQA